MFPHGEQVTILTAGYDEDPYSGKLVQSWEWTPTERTDTCGIAPGGSTEPNEAARNAIDSDFDLIFDHDPEITPVNRVIVDGLVCDVNGRPEKWRSPFTGWKPGVIVRVKIREG